MIINRSRDLGLLLKTIYGTKPQLDKVGQRFFKPCTSSNILPVQFLRRREK